jgi:hypothetical protein
MFNTATADDRVFSASWSGDATTDYIARLFFDHSEEIFLDEIYSDPNLTPVGIVNLSAAGNDIHVVWKDNLSNNKLRYKYYDDYPIPPQNLTVTKSVNNHPLLSWINPNPDASIYKIYRLNFCAGGWQLIGQTSNLYYEDLTQSYCTAVPPIQCTDLYVFNYKIKTVDIGLKESDYSNVVEVRLIGGSPSKAGINDPEGTVPFEYSLKQNYPNPFNPLTRIDYSIKSAGMVTLKVYDMLGTEVATLVNERKESGNYSLEFSAIGGSASGGNAGNLPSGIYVYTLISGDFVDSKKLILLK